MSEQINCPACSSSGHRTVVELGPERGAQFLNFSKIKYGGLLDDWLLKIPPVIVQCEHCSHCWYKTQPTKEQLETMYASARLIGTGTTVTRKPDKKIREELRKIRNLFGAHHRPSFLDYGSGYGRWSRSAALQGFEVTAFEPVVARGAESEHVDFELVHDLNAIGDRKFDFINLEQVLEHLTCPFDVLRQVGELCHEGTIVRTSVPNVLRSPEKDRIWDSWPFDGVRTHTMAPFEHLHGFTPGSLKTLGERAGYEVAGDLAIWRQYPADQLRHFIGRWFPVLDTSVFFFKRSFQ